MNFDTIPQGKISPFVACVYEIKNIKNKRTYIGSSTNPRSRIKLHFDDLGKGAHTNKKLQTDYNSFGIEAFSITILKQIKRLYSQGLGNEIRAIEQKFIDKRNPYYNTGIASAQTVVKTNNTFTILSTRTKNLILHNKLVKNRLAEKLNVSYWTIQRWIQNDSKLMTQADALEVIRLETGLTDVVILQTVSVGKASK